MITFTTEYIYYDNEKTTMITTEDGNCGIKNKHKLIAQENQVTICTINQSDQRHSYCKCT